MELKSVSALSGMDFLIKDYQRGYRWTPVEVETLLDDFAEFVDNTDKKPGEFYCLQPVVVREIDKKQYEVIDGQQRLTTLNLLLQYLSVGISFLYPNFKLYTIEYTTRPDSRDYLANIKNPKVSKEDYIDFYFLDRAYETIKKWFEKANDTTRNEILRALLETKPMTTPAGEVKDMANNIRVIWYEVGEDENTSSVEVFTRLNIGKIPLTDAELVKALFLSSSNFNTPDSELRKINLSNEWNMIEQHLHEDGFWYFLNRSSNQLQYSSRIEFIFDVISERSHKSPKYHTFNFIHRLIKEEGGEKVWMRIKKIYNLLNEWYSDRELYHIIGYLLEQGVSIGELISEWDKRNKSDFRDVYLKRKVKDTLKSIDNVSELSYSDKSKSNIRKVLLLFNILTVLKKDNSEFRFPFNRFKVEKWDIEHVCSQTDKELDKIGIPQWCEDMLNCFVGSSEKENIEKLISASACNEELKKILYKVAKLYQNANPDKETANNLFKESQMVLMEGDSVITDKDNISNLALLDYETNRSYGNAFFPLKRQRIIENDSMGVFVPIATKNLFLKYYTPNVGNMMQWTNEDGKNYIAAITELINNYIQS
ncbi:MAG: DUF262 domain-containing protein [Muribaculaceae bacterium]|nr:DUF262 domain-containing protein [Muribaculaceae bacterium]